MSTLSFFLKVSKSDFYANWSQPSGFQTSLNCCNHQLAPSTAGAQEPKWLPVSRFLGVQVHGAITHLLTTAAWVYRYLIQARKHLSHQNILFLIIQ